MTRYDRISLENFATFWLDLFPEFKDSKEFDEMNTTIPYSFLSDFGRFFMDRLKKDGEGDLVVQRVFAVLNEVFNDPSVDPEVANLLQVELCEILASSKKGLALAEKLLQGKSIEYLNMSRKWLNPVSDE
jgi:hypothetical protein